METIIKNGPSPIQELAENTNESIYVNEADIENLNQVKEDNSECEAIEKQIQTLSNKLKKCNPVSNKTKGGSKKIEKNITYDINNENSDNEDIYIHAKELTGIWGLKRVMNFIDSKSPLEKGAFEYKTWVKEKYGNIFSSNNIGKFSSKIKSICENIYDTKTNRVSDGIVLIYSSYIDGGIIPMALALEEMGFTRFGQNVKPLFKTPQNEIVDVRTMKPPVNKKDFFPAKYIMITGDVRLSPNNIADVNALTNEDNVNGNKIKVVLISQAGSEGIDFKAIRQIHIMDPWYNMSRIEQITGRGVRNFSHKGLPFEERNVEIFLHGTILNNPEEESADLYVYRIAELKAIQIGKITRLLKQTSVDCIINYEQTDFTVDNFKQIESNKYIKQILSNGLEIDNFEVGDVPNSANCDYMTTCQYVCLPNKEIRDSDLNFDTYTEKFMLANSDKIIQKMRALMKMRYFYKKKDLIHYLNTPKKYPIAQIYSALTQMINDHTEYIADKYGRTGYLVNIGDYYLFQPSELNYDNISIYDRSVPIDVKHNMIKFHIKQPVLANKNVEFNREILQSNVIDRADVTTKEFGTLLSGKKILQDMRNNYDIARTTSKVERGEENWYKFCGVVITKMKNDGINIGVLQDFLIEHIIETLMYNEKIDLLNYLNLDNEKCSHPSESEDLFLFKIKKYFCDKIIYYKKLMGIVFFDGPSRKTNLKIYILKNKLWVPAEPEDIREIGVAINEKYKLNLNLNQYVGFMGFEDKRKYMIFKVKDTTKIRHTGSRCDQSGKKKTIVLLNEILGKNEYTKENTKGIVQEELCILQEFILRNFDKEQKDGKTWFLNTELAVINEF